MALVYDRPRICYSSVHANSTSYLKPASAAGSLYLLETAHLADCAHLLCYTGICAVCLSAVASFPYHPQGCSDSRGHAVVQL
jgi:hypothetical protein